MIEKTTKLYKQWISLEKSASRTTGKAPDERAQFQESLDDLFDVAHVQAMGLIKNPEDRAFLDAQRRRGRPGSMVGIDKSWCQKKAEKNKRLVQEEKRRDEANKYKASTSTSVQLEETSSSSQDTSPEASLSRSRKQSSDGAPPPKRIRTVITPQVASALDRSQISNRQATHLLVPFAAELGHDLTRMSISPRTIGRQRRKLRMERAAEIQSSFIAPGSMTLHWDGKLMQDITGNDRVDRLPILVSGHRIVKIIAVPKLPDGKAETTAAAISNAIADWDMTDKITALCFDTTAVNTGAKSGVCVRLEKLLGRQLLHLACRHNIMELVLEAVFSALFPDQSRSKDITMFLDFRDMWTSIDQEIYSTTSDDEATAARVRPWREDVIKFAEDQLKMQLPRDDYKEFLELVIVFLGSIPSRRKNPLFRVPGAIHRARWMGRAIYSLKMWLFLDQYENLQPTRSSSRGRKETNALQSGLTDFCVFLEEHYVRPWFTAMCPEAAPRTDLDLLKKLAEHPNSLIRHAGTKTMARHLWYISEVTVGLSLFDDSVPTETKRRMAHHLQTVEGSWTPSPRLAVKPEIIKKDISDFFTKSTKKLLDQMAIDPSFLEENPDSWDQTEAFIRGKDTVKLLLVTNDAAERGVALIQKFTNKGRTKNEDQLGAMIHVVEEHRKRFPSADKAILMTG